MGEVWRARDTKLGREVAIKVLPAGLSADKDRLARFEQEAQAAGALNHPNILVIYHIGTHEGAPYIVSELLEGETLRERMGGAPLPHRKAIDYALQTARGLAAAHEKGIVHRDLKPDNLFITKDGRMKILDFGLAKLTTSDGSQSQTAVPTRRVNTDPGMVMGTIGYMSPEQVRGKAADHRSDIFSFGAILYEMLSGRRAFRGESTADTISAILREDPPELSTTNRTINPSFERVVNHCLEKNPEERFNSARDLAFAIEALSAPSTSSESTLLSTIPTSKRKRQDLIAWTVAAVLLIACTTLAVLYFWPRSIDKRQISFTIEMPEKVVEIRTPTVSPDGRMIVFQGVAEGKVGLYVRNVDSINTQRLAGTDDASFPFWSPDSRYVGFFSDNRLKKVDITGGMPQTICPVAEPIGGAWNRDGVIVLAQGGQGLHRVSAAGGESTLLLSLDTSKNEIDHDFPAFLPDGKHFLYYSFKGDRGSAEIYIGSLQGDRKLLLRNDSNAAYLAPGYLLFAREFILMAQAFDASKLELTGEPFTVMENVAYSTSNSYSHFSVSDNGTLAYWKGTDVGRQLAWFDRTGKQITTVGPPGTYNDIVLSPDSKRAAIQDIHGGNSDIWIMDLVRGVPVRFTFTPNAQDDNPSWSADGSFLFYTVASEGKATFFKKNASGAGTEEKIYEPTAGIDDGTDVSPDGKNLLFETVGEKTQSDIWVLPLDGSGSAHSLFASNFAEFHAHFSPDGHWIAYASSESGRPEIYVQSFPPAGGKWQVSTGGGAQPHWRRDGKELYFIAPDRKLMAVEVKLGATFEMGTPAPLFQTQVSSFGSPNRYDVAADGQRFLVNTAVQEPSRTPIVVILNWAAPLKKP